MHEQIGVGTEKGRLIFGMYNDAFTGHVLQLGRSTENDSDYGMLWRVSDRSAVF